MPNLKNIKVDTVILVCIPRIGNGQLIVNQFDSLVHVIFDILTSSHHFEHEFFTGNKNALKGSQATHIVS